MYINVLSVFTAVGFLILTGWSSSTRAQTVSATPNVYDIQVEELLLCTDVNCSTSTTLSSTTATFSLAASGAPATDTKPYTINRIVQQTGVYTHMRMKVANSVAVSGTVPNVGNPAGGTMNCTTTAGGTSLLNGDRVLVVTNGAAEATMNYVVAQYPPNFAFNLPPNLTIGIGGASIFLRYQLPQALNVSVGDTIPEVDVKFLVTNSLNAAGTAANTCTIWISPPTIRIVPR
ncbi:MAG: hypothetical protein ABJH63_08885 [Rhizobiaceae bacterium]